MKYIANPVEVDAEIIGRIEEPDVLGNITAHLLGAETFGETFPITPSMVSRYNPLVGDYLVRQSDGYVYLNPKEVFERKYRRA